VLIGPLVAVPFDYLIASNKLGQWARRQGWFLIPEEIKPPRELMLLQSTESSAVVQEKPADEYGEDFGLAQTVLDPRMNAIHVSLLRERQLVPLRTHEHLTALCERLLQSGPTVMPAREKKVLLWDADSMQALHQKLWCTPESEWHEWWLKAFRRYVQSLPHG